MSVDYKDLFEYRDGNLYWKAKTSPTSRVNIGDMVGYKTWNKYIIAGIDGKKEKVHRIIWQMFNGSIDKGKVIDHINNNPSDNRIENLQCITQAQNIQRRVDGSGATKIGKKWRAQRQVNKVMHYFGTYGTPCGAYMASKMFFIGGQYV